VIVVRIKYKTYTMKRKVIYLALIAILSMGVIYSCKKTGSTSVTTTQPVDDNDEVEIEDMQFKPSTITVSAGTTVTWRNKDDMQHTVTDRGGAFDSGTIGISKTYRFTFTTAGTYTYHCTIHSTMADATVVVK